MIKMKTQKKYKLTISILVSNKAEYVQRCLDSIQHLMKVVPCELILTDTGCDESTRKIMENYTSHIIDFEWCRDFAAARNVGLHEASGEWFLYLDDDEWFQDTDEIETFFSSGMCDHYNVAFYVQRNYLDFEEKTYIDQNVDRILRINPDLKFIHRVHEAYSGIDVGKKKALNSYVHHYGYIYENEEERLEKHKRNQELLELECRDYPKDMRMQYQAVINLFDMEEWDEAIKRAEAAIRQKSDSEYWDACHTAILYCYEKKKDYQKLICTAKEFLKEDICAFDKLGIYEYIIDAYWNVGGFEELVPYAVQALTSYGMYMENPETYNCQQLMRTEFTNKEQIHKVLAYSIIAGLICNRSDFLNLVLSEAFLPDIRALYTDEIHGIWMKKTAETVCVDEERRNLAQRVINKLASNDKIDDMEEYINLLNLAEKIIWLLRLNYSMRAGKKLSDFFTHLQNKIPEFIERESENFIDRLGLPLLMQAQENEDEILIADVLEGQTVPTLEQMIQAMMKQNPISEIDYTMKNIMAYARKREYEDLVAIICRAIPRDGCNYSIERTASGQLTLCLNENNRMYYISGNNNPYRDAHRFFENNGMGKEVKYVLLGAGMLYEAQVLLEERPDLELIVAEEDPYLLSLVFRYRNLEKLLENERLTIEIGSYASVLGRLENDTKIIIHKPSLRHIANSNERQILDEYYIKMMTMREQKGISERNFKLNICNKTKVIAAEKCRDFFKDKTVFLVAGGPSLRHSLDLLRNKRENDVILCVGTVARLLMREKIVPDFVIITDGLQSVLRQVEGVLDSEKTKLLYMCTANAEAVGSFSGEKYAVFQKGYDDAEVYAAQHGIELVATGGSVSTTAIDICIRYGCKKIICLGLDLAYTDNQTHASGTLSEMNISDREGMYSVTGILGNEVKTISSLNMFRKWIEERIREESEIEFVNISNGAYIEGMKNLVPSEILVNLKQ